MKAKWRGKSPAIFYAADPLEKGVFLQPQRLVKRRRAALAVAAPTSRPLQLKLGKIHPEERDAACYGHEYRRAETFGRQR